MSTIPSKATHALLGYYKGSVGVISWHDNEFDAWRECKLINSSKGKVKVVPVVDGNLTPKHLKEKSDLFEAAFNRFV